MAVAAEEIGGPMAVGTKRYTLVIPDPLFEQVSQLAEERGTTVVEVLRKFIRLGLLVAATEDSPETRLIIREGDTERELVLL